MSVCEIQLLLAPSTIISLISFCFLLVPLVNQINHNFYHHILLFRLALGNHQSQGYKGVVCQSLGTVLTIEYTIIIEEPKEQRGSNTFVTIAERVVLGDEIKQHGSLLLHAGIEFVATKSLVNLTNTTLEGIIFLVTKECRPS